MYCGYTNFECPQSVGVSTIEIIELKKKFIMINACCVLQHTNSQRPPTVCAAENNILHTK